MGAGTGSYFQKRICSITEWLEHYLSQGVGHFFLIDNGSTDDSCEKLVPYMEEGLVTLVHDAKRWAQKSCTISIFWRNDTCASG